MNHLLTLCGLAALASTSFAGEIVVPTDQPNLAAAIAAAVAGDVIIVRTSLDQGGSGQPITVDKPLSIVGDPVCNIRLTSFTDSGLLLSGSGGEVLLSGINMTYKWTDSDGGFALQGGGFDAVHVFESTIVHNNIHPSGAVSFVMPGILLDSVGRLNVVDSSIGGGGGGLAGCGSGLWFPDSAAGIQAPNTVVTLVNSSVAGGQASFLSENSWDACPQQISSWGGAGGDGVVAAEVHAWNSVVTGGAGLLWISANFCPGGMELQTMICGKVPSGTAIVSLLSSGTVDCSRLTQADSTITIGGTWDLNWADNSSGCAPVQTGAPALTPAFLFAALSSMKVLSPALPLGDVYLQDLNLYHLATFDATTGTGPISFNVPNIAELAGIPVTAQVLLSTGEISGPTSGILVP